jgi:hypothetical protein
MKSDFGHTPAQRNLFQEIVPDAGVFVRAAMNDALRACSLSRDQVVDEMNRLATLAGITCNGRSREVTRTILEKWVAPGATQHTIPLRMLPVFCRAVGSNRPLVALAACCLDAVVIGNEDAGILEWARVEIQARQYRKRASELGKDVGAE